LLYSASETKLAAISALMSDFSTRVMEQAETIDSVLDLTQQSTEHLDRGQKELLVLAIFEFRSLVLCFSSLTAKLLIRKRRSRAFIFACLFPSRCFSPVSPCCWSIGDNESAIYKYTCMSHQL
jgi:hypothetical protein